jgi:hypothetical protein
MGTRVSHPLNHNGGKQKQVIQAVIEAGFYNGACWTNCGFYKWAFMILSLQPVSAN